MYSSATTRIDLRNGPALTQTFATFPSIKSRLHDWNVSAEYQLRENLALRVSYLLEDLRTDDWAYDGVGFATIGQVLGTGQTTANYRNHLIGFAVRYEFR